MIDLILWNGMTSRPPWGRVHEYLPEFRVCGPMVGRQTEEAESNLRLAIFQVDDVSFGGEIHYYPWYQGILGLSLRARRA